MKLNKKKAALVIVILQPLTWFGIYILVKRMLTLSDSENFMLAMACFVSCFIAVIILGTAIEDNF